MRVVSLAARRSAEDAASDEVEVVLMRFSGGPLAEPVLLSTDPTARLADDPLTYGTRSRWQSTAREDYLFVPARAVLPDDQDDQPPAASVMIDILDAAMVEPLRSFVERSVQVDVAVVLASSPDAVEAEWRGLWLLAVDGDAGMMTLTIGREDETGEPHSALRMTREIAPGLHR
ncbi:hypothetical protein [Oharaeibacter diazotrophicus]|uniref:Uncharacterized protein n=1 Tax=Oharaeibacter diazotrophicus TaxID=1920512 RepID=A0A4R6RHS8_9HYPH|nr:hypothetical protein [Oharaeibacter diazotrophicus]TDP85397.1 hypothetical protein EDD54_2250 [Oharaeibacter diazotrophicus]BBE74367.1 hypothetical protein OHA_1_03998 [Pleomorphomonas sp. SM30]GLS75940.1 hypothetical protein GCM10007904_12750 [Oharaeibacter diazotrophicus]